MSSLSVTFLNNNKSRLNVRHINGCMWLDWGSAQGAVAPYSMGIYSTQILDSHYKLATILREMASYYVQADTRLEA